MIPFNTKRLLILIIVALLVSSASLALYVSSPSAKVVNNDKAKEKFSSLSEIPEHKVISINRDNSNEGINPYIYYSQEPAPMGIADYGLGPNEQPYAYETTQFLGIVNGLILTHNSSLNQSADSMTFQLNVNFVFQNGNNQYSYWIQDVANLNTSGGTNYIMFIDNIWNDSSFGGSMYNTTVSGNGTVGNSGGTGFYYSWANQYLPGNDVILPGFYNIQFKVISYLNNQGYPAVAFLYNDGYGWITYDNAVFKFANDLTSYPYFLVDGYNYEPDGRVYDAELILGGPGGGTQTYDVFSDLSLYLEYWNGFNFQMVPNAYNFGSHTAEGISNAISTQFSFVENGTFGACLINGSGQLGILYQSNELSYLNFNLPINSGTLYVNNTPYEFYNYGLHLSLFPSSYQTNFGWHSGYYTLYFYNNQGQLIWERNVNLIANQTLTINLYNVTFTETGLPSGTGWYLTITNGPTIYSYNNTISIFEENGTFYYSISSSNKNYFASGGTFTISGSNIAIYVQFVLKSYTLTFIESGLPSGTPWAITLVTYNNSGPVRNTLSSFSNEIVFSVTPGYYFYYVNFLNGYVPTISANSGNVSSNITQYIQFIKADNQYLQVGSQPDFVLYDNINKLVYVANFNSSSVSVLNGTTVVNSIPTTQNPEELVLDPNNGLIYVLMVSGGIGVINTVGNYDTLILKNYYFNNLVFDPNNGYLYASGYNNLTVIDPMTDQVVQVISLSIPIYEMTLDTQSNTLYAISGENVSVINPANGDLEAIINLNYYPAWIAYDQVNGEVYVAVDTYNINAIGLSVDSSNGYLLVISGFSIIKEISTGFFPIGISIDPLNGNVFISNLVSDDVQIVDGQNNTIIGNIPVYIPLFSALDTSNGLLYITSEGGNYVFMVTIQENYTVTFINKGLPSGTAWYVNISNVGSFKSTGNSINVSLSDGSYNYDISTSDKKYAPEQNSGSFTVNGKGIIIYVNFKLVTYSIIFRETGLPTGQQWSVTLGGAINNSNSNMIIFNEPNGTYLYSLIATINGTTGTRYITLNPTGNVTIDGANVTIDVSYLTQYYLIMLANPSNGGSITPTGGWYNAGSSVTINAIPNSNFEFVSWTGTGSGSYSGTGTQVTITINSPITEQANFIELYSITFTESGLPAGTIWYVNTSNGQSYSSSGTSISVHMPNGSYSYTIATADKEYSAQGGSFIVSGFNIEISIRFNLVTYAITFTESGLPSGTSWSLTLNNITKSSTTNTITFNEPNGTYSYSISGISGYRPNTYSGTVIANGNTIDENITWSVILYPITITENGIPNGTSWSATITGTAFNGQYINVTLSSTTNTITFNEPNGSYSYTIHLPSGYNGNNLSGTVDLVGSSITLSVKAYQTTNYLVYAIVGIVAIVVIFGVLFAINGRKNKR